MNGVFIRGGHRPDAVEIDGFTIRIRGLSWQMDRLAKWAGEIVRRNCMALGIAGGALVPLGEYLEIVRLARPPRKRAFLAMLEWWSD
jgi:hypothetical protein